jgi:hypothetical protein
MNSQFLDVLISNAAEEMAEMLGALRRGGLRPRDALWYCHLCRIRGIGQLLLDGTPESFHRELWRSGRVIWASLERADDSEKATGRLFPFFDAVSVTDWEGAAGIAAHARRSWNHEKEYEEEFLYAYFLMNLFFMDGDIGACTALLRRYEEVVDGEPDTRLGLCKALLGGEQIEFDAALAAFLDEYLERYRRLTRKEAISQEVAATEAHVSIEGLALLRLAQRRGLKPRRDYPGVPSIALKEPTVRYGRELLDQV